MVRDVCKAISCVATIGLEFGSPSARNAFMMPAEEDGCFPGPYLEGKACKLRDA